MLRRVRSPPGLAAALATLALAAALPLVACTDAADGPAAGGTGGAGGDGGFAGAGGLPLPITDTPSGLLLAARALQCQRLVRCEPKLDSRYGPLLEPRACHPAEELFGLITAQADAGAAAGRARFDAGSAAACVEAIRASASCGIGLEELFPDDPACDAAYVGLVADGGACLLDAECGDESFCRIDESCPGVCVARGLDGAICDGDGQCAGSFRCSEHRCTAELPAGAPCDGELCAAGLECLRGTSGRTCSALPVAGAPCFVTLGRSGCAAELVCNGATATAPGSCGPGGAEGAGCSSTEPCSPGTRCLGGACVPLSPPGGRCESSIHCPFGFDCSRGRCVPGPALGDPCSSRCVQGSCWSTGCTLLPDGAACSGALATPLGECEGYCSGGITSGTCRPLLAAGAPCSADDACGPAQSCSRSLATDQDRCQLRCPP